MVKILHIFPDDKFFDDLSVFFDSLEGIENEYVFYAEKDFEFKYIKQTEKILKFTSRCQYKSYIKNSTAQIVYLHALRDYSTLKYFRKDAKVVWWSWGFDIYSKPSILCSPLLNLDLYKPLTQNLEKSDRLDIKNYIKQFILKYWIKYWRKKAVKRIDYFTPVLSCEYELLKQIKYFRAKPFCIENGPGILFPIPFSYKSAAGNVIVGNSFSPTNNHLDVFEIIKKYKSFEHKFLIPINYGDGYDISAEDLIKLSELEQSKTIWLKDFVPFDEYSKLFDSVSHAIFGHIRQQAVGNHRMCILNGIKMYFFKDSINYKYYCEKGFYVYTIEEDLSLQSLQEPLTKEQALHNYNLLLDIVGNNKENYEIAFKNIVLEK